MKFSVNKSDLLKKLTPAMGNVATKDNIPAIEGVLLETVDDGTLRITTYDLDKGFRATLPTLSVEREGKCIINAQRLYQTVKVLPDDEIEFDINDRLQCTVSCGKSVFSMSASKGADFPNIPDLVTERGFTVGADNLKKMISKVSHSIAVSDTRPMLCGAFFKIFDGGFEIVSCDSYRLSKCTLKCDINNISSESLNYSFIIPGYALGEMIKNLGEGADEVIKFYLSRKHAIITKGDTTFFTRLIDSEYIDYQRIIPKDNDIIVNIDRNRFMSGLERASIIAEEKIQGSARSYVKLEIDSHYLNLSSISVRGGLKDEMDCIHEGGSIEIGFNCRYLIDAVKAAEGENIIIKLKSPNQAVTIEPAEEDESFNYFYMILPVRMNENK